MNRKERRKGRRVRDGEAARVETATEAETRSTLGQILPARKVSATTTTGTTTKDRAVGAADTTIAAKESVLDTAAIPTQTKAVFREKTALLSTRGSVIRTAVQVPARVTSISALARETTKRNGVDCRRR